MQIEPIPARERNVDRRQTHGNVARSKLLVHHEGSRKEAREFGEKTVQSARFFFSFATGPDSKVELFFEELLLGIVGRENVVSAGSGRIR